MSQAELNGELFTLERFPPNAEEEALQAWEAADEYLLQQVNDVDGLTLVLLSFGIALALVPLLIFTSNAQLMGDLVNTRWVRVTGWVIVVIVVSLNGWLIVGSLLGVA